MNNHLADFAQTLAELKAIGQFRQLPQLDHQGKMIVKDGRTMLNMSSNDYLGLANDDALKTEFLKNYGENLPHFTSSSSRLLTGSFAIYEQLESLMASRFEREACLLFNSGYHANIGILPAVANKKTLILADKLVHASIIDGIRLSEADFVRYRHNDFNHLETLLAKHQAHYQRMIIVTESIFSMDGDVVDLRQLVALKHRFGNVMLYVDEAHAIGAYGDTGLGIAEQQGCVQEIDFLVGTFGKALASMGAYVVCDQLLKDYLINKMRPLIFSTALPPICVAWTAFLFEKLPHFATRRQHLHQISEKVRSFFRQNFTLPIVSESGIIPYIIGDNERTVATAQTLQQQGYYCLPIRPPTVPQGTSRIRLSLTADMSEQEVDAFLTLLQEFQQ
ncbi:8-amino-7-oxononanoate synthase [Avibacterium paragallinarum]|uniref:8-amino-7-ketopelargonate synthase n=3 Tax=Avibacterium paragallinarum TaxID=728 RepID=A0AAE5WHS8_AVIPA|nr:8-amino-7-oxononanoate synthase [Avibacterium paragallinarum]MEE3609544.1 8-amino-7-oxononanoate synthase [Avibacterium paragallinarum]MEE3621401.1 8-amino-7-oxononanoate synthase [Avibacterium paragallinarum]MEE3669201.1 8-amino-7-oxononanoate synthase [Avibacterium paragallinarum]MEE3681583.1 8-amino-7-oxononanoate synthase [Avibacterium paragallinarum]MEE4386908.1 8-amino-7-oxononanoate synthase [Avibacterium paragallinarum]